MAVLAVAGIYSIDEKLINDSSSGAPPSWSDLLPAHSNTEFMSCICWLQVPLAMGFT